MIYRSCDRYLVITRINPVIMRPICLLWIYLCVACLIVRPGMAEDDLADDDDDYGGK